MISLIFTRRFSMAHRLLGPDAGKCDVPHGHNEIVRVHLKATEAAPLDGDSNMVASFEDAKKDWHAWIDDHVDHSFQLSESDPLIDWFRENEPDKLSSILITPGDPTTELLAALFMSKVNAMLTAGETGLVCHRIDLEETPTNAITLEGPAEGVLPPAIVAGSAAERISDRRSLAGRAPDRRSSGGRETDRRASDTAPLSWWQRADSSINDLD